MSVDYEECEGSPSMEVERTRTRGKRVFRVAWADVPTFVDTELFPNPLAGYNGLSTFGVFTDLKAVHASVEPFVPDGMTGNGEAANSFAGGAKVTVDYEIPQFDRGLQSGGRDFSGPGGREGSTGNSGSPAGQDATFLTHSVGIGGQFFTLPPQSLQWADGTTATIVGEDTHAALIVPTTEHTITWNYVAFPPWDAISTTAGAVNKFKFTGAPPETLLFLGANATQDITSKGVQAWKLEYKFSQRNAGNVGLLVSDPVGWNHFIRPDGATPGLWRKIQRKDGSPIFRLADFKPLFKQVIP